MLDRVFDNECQKKLKQELDFIEPFTSMDQLETRKSDFSNVECIFSTWGHPELSAEQIRKFFPKLKYVFYGAGTVQYFARPFFECGVRIFSAADANSIPVVEYCLAQILLANKGFYQTCAIYSEGDYHTAKNYTSKFPGNYGEYVGIIGVGKIGRGVVEALRPYKLKIAAYDPFLSDEASRSLGVELWSLDKIFEECSVISNHLANNDQTQGILHYGHFSKMKPFATFINTGRGAQVVEADLVRALEEDASRTAILDVTWPEPCEDNHPFFKMKNIFLTPHIAGSVGEELARMGEFMYEEWDAINCGKASKYEVTAAMLETMA